jgi:hypothetical protein
MIQTTTRNADLGDLAQLLQQQHARKLDVVAHSSQITAVDGCLLIEGTEAVLSEEGVSSSAGLYRPTAVADEGIAAKLGIPTQYLRRMREQRPDLYDANVNGWLRGSILPSSGLSGIAGDGPDPRRFLLRCFRGDGNEEGIARAWLSDSYKVIDNLDVLMAALDGVRAAGVEVDIAGCDLTDRRMYVRVKAPQVQAYAPKLLQGYRSPFTGASGTDNPTVFAGFELSNSETGGGAFQIVPRIVIQVCDNGMKLTRDAVRSVHLGGKLEEGIIRWSEETQQRSIELVKAKTADAVRTFLDADYVQRAVEALERKAEEPVEGVEEVKVMTKQLAFSPAETDGILGHFIKGGQLNRAGVANAITSFSQTVEDADSAAEMEERAATLLSV